MSSRARVKIPNVKPVPCPGCGTRLDCAEIVSAEDGQPTPGCRTICIRCKTWNVLLEDGSLRPATEDELFEMWVEHPEMVSQIERAIEKMHRTTGKPPFRAV